MQAVGRFCQLLPAFLVCQQKLHHAENMAKAISRLRNFFEKQAFSQFSRLENRDRVPLRRLTCDVHIVSLHSSPMYCTSFRWLPIVSAAHSCECQLAFAGITQV